MSCEKITCFFLSLLIQLRPQKSPERDGLLSPIHGLFAIAWEEQITANGATCTHWWGARAGTLTDRQTVPNVQPQ